MNPPGSPTLGGAAPSSDPLLRGNGSANLSMNGGGMEMPGNAGSMPMMGGTPSLSSNPAPGTAMSMNPGSLGSKLSPMDPDLPASMSPSASGSNRLPAPTLQQASLPGEDSSHVRDASYHSVDLDTTPHLPMNGKSGGMMIPPPPAIPATYSAPPSSTKKSDTAKSKTSSDRISGLDSVPPPASLPPVPPPSPMSSAGQDPLSNPAPSVTVGSSTSLPGAARKRQRIPLLRRSRLLTSISRQ